MWVWIAVVVIALIVLIFAASRLLGRLPGLRRAALKLQRRQEEALGLQAGAEQLQETMLGLQERAERAHDKVAQIQAARGR
ncbi:hypothetical protein QLQ12_16080 [Actinoplanes sp. NEAU-A12]|uniref:DNA recombination protein RmuC n=1 Tax=Actinoplanes sandaracinus TaxID=3045177 RepID=A0ABT6WK68_9ACTN|nr:hypothetical protein [Actinoplanes sandaracinus]MDI6100122.1 hypothetical protein [Actinoplanes sandaracinus]